jgi:hypothetical protein
VLITSKSKEPRIEVLGSRSPIRVIRVNTLYAGLRLCGRIARVVRMVSLGRAAFWWEAACVFCRGVISPLADRHAWRRFTLLESSFHRWEDLILERLLSRSRSTVFTFGVSPRNSQFDFWSTAAPTEPDNLPFLKLLRTLRVAHACPYSIGAPFWSCSPVRFAPKNCFSLAPGVLLGG